MSTCSHVMEPLMFSTDQDSLTVFVTQGRHIRQRQNFSFANEVRGLYLDPVWDHAETGPGTVIVKWPDYGIPASPTLSRHQIIDAFIAACDMDIVEVGCIGAHGRTGTVLACFAVLAGIPDPVEWVRQTYCPKAVETDQQERYVEWFENQCFGDQTMEYPWEK